MTALLIAEHDNVTLKPATAQALTAALRMTDVVDVLVAGSNGQSVAEQAAKLSGRAHRLLRRPSPARPGVARSARTPRA